MARAWPQPSRDWRADKGMPRLLGSGACLLKPTPISPQKGTCLVTDQRSHSETVEMPSQERLQELLFAAARMGRNDMIPDLLKAGATIEGRDPRGYTALILASYNGQESTTGLLLSLGAEVNAGDGERGNTALMGISFKGYPGIARLLVASGADVNARNFAGQTALMTAVLFNQLEIVNLLVEAGADPSIADAHGNTVTKLALMNGHQHLVERFQTH